VQGDKIHTLETLRQQIAALETNPLLKDAALVSVPAGLLAPPSGSVHEVFADGTRDGGAALGFAFAQTRFMLEPNRSAVLFLQLRADAQELGLPYGLGLGGFGLDAERLVYIRPETIAELLWAIEEAIACRAVAAVVADIAHPHKALDFIASRRLSLRAAASGASVFLVRYGREREASAAKFRWRVAPALSQPPPYDANAPGLPRWRVTLEKGSLGGRRKAAPGGEVFLVDWTENGFERVDADGRTGGARRAAAVSGAPSAALGDRLSEAG
jgi:protein ImuA